MSKHYVGEAGTILYFDTGIDMTSALNVAIKYKSPSAAGTWVGAVYNSYSTLAAATGSYYITYTVLNSSFNVSGEWKFQSFVITPAGTWYGETVDETIYDAFE